jgi:hypothetical protein
VLYVLHITSVISIIRVIRVIGGGGWDYLVGRCTVWCSRGRLLERGIIGEDEAVEFFDETVMVGDKFRASGEQFQGSFDVFDEQVSGFASTVLVYCSS